MKISIIGSGAMGSLFGGRLSIAGHEVILYDVYREHVEAVNRDGLAIEQAGSAEVTVARPAASVDPEAVRGCDAMIVFVKSTSTADVARQFVPCVRADTVVLTLQNGLGNEAIIRESFGAARGSEELHRRRAGKEVPGRGAYIHHERGDCRGAAQGPEDVMRRALDVF